MKKGIPMILISAKLTPEAWTVYNSYKEQRRGGHAISEALIYWSQKRDQVLGRELVDREMEIREMKKNIAALQQHVTKFAMESESAWDEIRDLYCPKKPESDVE